MSLVLPRAAGRQAAPSWITRAYAHDLAFGRLALWLPVVMAAGIAAAVAAPFDPSPLALALGFGGVLVLRRVAGRVPHAAAASGPLLVLAAALAGAFLLALQSEWRGTPVLTKPQTARLVGLLTAVERASPVRHTLTIAVETSDLRGPVPRRVRVAVRGAAAYRVGQRVRTTARLFPLRGPAYPGGYDAARRLYFDGIGATGFSYGPPQVVEPSSVRSLPAVTDAVRAAVAARVAAVLPPREGAFASALLVGRRGEMAPADVEALRVSGLGHILAISGLHMALVAGSVFAAVRRLLALVPAVALRWPIRKWAAVAGLAAAAGYLALSGGSVATVRAFIMLAVALVAILADRPALTMRTVAVAAVIVMVLDPVSVVEPGFQMSFLAVVALVGACEWWAGRRRRTSGSGPAGRIAAFLLGLALTSLIAGLATAPAAAYHFHRLAPLGLVANLAAMPILTFLAMPAGVVSMLAMPLGLEALPLTAMGAGLSAILSVAHAVAGWTGPHGLTGTVPAAAALLCALGLLCLAILTAPWRLGGVLLIAGGLALAPLAPRYDVFVSDDGSTVAARGPDGRLGFHGRAGSFAAQTWLTADGDPRAPGTALVVSRCDALGCTLPLGDGTLAVVRSPRALAEDCVLAEAVVTTERLGACPAPLAIDRDRLVSGGTIAARLTATGWRIVPARAAGARRHWHVAPTVRHGD